MLLLGGIQAAAAFFFTENLSTALIILGISCVMIFLAHPKTAPFLAALAVIGLVVGVVLFYLAQTMDSSSNFRLQRVLVWLDPEKYSANGGYQVLQGLYAIGSGGFFGKGLGNSTQKLSTIPEAQNDMIFSIICEELGLFGAIIVLLLFGYLLYRLFFIAQNAPDLYGTLIVSGIFCSHRSSGGAEHLRGAECDSDDGSYAALRQLWRHFCAVPHGGDGHSPERIPENTFSG